MYKLSAILVRSIVYVQSIEINKVETWKDVIPKINEKFNFFCTLIQLSSEISTIYVFGD